MKYQNSSDFERVYDQYADMLYRLALSYLNSSFDAQDVLQDVFLRYLKKAPRFNDEDHKCAWLVRVTINRCHDFLRSKKNHLSLEEAAELPFDKKEMPLGLFEQLGLLPEKYRTVIILHYLEGYSVKEVSFMLQLSLSAVKMRLLRGKKILSEAMKKEEDYV